MGGENEEMAWWTLLEIAFTVCFFSKEKTRMHYPPKFFSRTFGDLSEGYNPMLLTNVFQVVNDTLRHLRIVNSGSCYSSAESKELLLNGYVSIKNFEDDETKRRRW